MRFYSIYFTFFLSSFVLGQTITVGSSSTTTTTNPIKSNSSYSYSQQIYLSNEGTPSLLSSQVNKYITVLRFYWAGTGTLANSGTWAIYLGNTTQNTFTTTSWVTSANMTLVFSGAVTLPAASGWMTINLATPFLYTGNNLVVAVDENTIGASTSLAAWRYTTTSASYRAINISGTTNYSPAVPPAGTITFSRPNIQLDFYAPSSPTSISASQPTICPGGSSTLTAVGNSGTTYWFTSSCGNSIGSSIGSGASLVVSPATTTTYYCRNYSNGMWSVACASSTIAVSSLPNTPPTPTSNSPFCGNVTLTATSPPAGVNWYWQTTSTGTSTVNGGNTLNVNTSGTYYLRAMSSIGCWSTNSSSLAVTVLPVPNAPNTPTSNSPQCDSVILSHVNPPAGVVWYWQGTNSNGNATNLGSGINYTANSTGTYYLAALNTQGCWSVTTPLSVIVYGRPSTPPAPISNSPQCDTVTLSWMNSPPQGVNWYWQTQPSGVSTLYPAPSFSTNTSGVVYIRARNSGGCWSLMSSNAMAVVTGYPFAPNIPLTTSPSCDSVIMTMSGQPPNDVNWYWQGTIPNGASTINSNLSTTVYSSGVYYIRARNNANCWSATSTPVLINVYQPSFSTITPIVCDTYTAPDGQVYSTSGQYEALIMNYLGCDSTVEINLQVNPSYNVWDNHDACDSYTWIDGQTYSTNNTTSTYTYQTIHGCDSVIHLNLEIGYSPDTVIIEGSAIDGYELNGIFYNQDGVYYQTIINEYGCDSIIKLVLNVDYTGIVPLNQSAIIYPNPSSDGVFFFDSPMEYYQITAMDALGKQVMLLRVAEGYKISSAKGLYFIEVKAERQTWVFKWECF